MSVSELQRAAVAAAEHYRQAWELESEKLDKFLAYHETPPNNYWVKEHRARALYYSALTLVELLCCEEREAKSQ